MEYKEYKTGTSDLVSESSTLIDVHYVDDETGDDIYCLLMRNNDCHFLFESVLVSGISLLTEDDQVLRNSEFLIKLDEIRDNALFESKPYVPGDYPEELLNSRYVQLIEMAHAKMNNSYPYLSIKGIGFATADDVIEGFMEEWDKDYVNCMKRYKDIALENGKDFSNVVWFMSGIHKASKDDAYAEMQKEFDKYGINIPSIEE